MRKARNPCKTAEADARIELEARADNALDVFYHPYAYAPVWASAAAAFAA